MPTNLLNDDGTASMATLIMCSHHAFRRDVRCFATALAAFDPARATVLRAEWAHLREALHGHHTVEDTSMFPDLRSKDPSIASIIDQLEAHHHAIDPLLDRGDVLFASLTTNVAAARALVASLATLLDEHLELEERTITPHLRSAKTFPSLPEDALAGYADGFAWSAAGISESVLTQVFAMLPSGLTSRLPAARDAFADRCRSVWGRTLDGASTTSVPLSA